MKTIPISMFRYSDDGLTAHEIMTRFPDCPVKIPPCPPDAISVRIVYHAVQDEIISWYETKKRPTLTRQTTLQGILKTMSATKFTVLAIVAVFLASVGYGLYQFAIGGYLTNNTIGGLFVVLIVGLSLFWGIKWLKKVWPTLVLLLLLTSCERVKSNQQFVVSEDCGKTWKKINAGEHVPKAGTNFCYMSVVMPNFPMQGDSRFMANLKEKVRANTHIDYDYVISDPLAFIGQAKYLGKSNVNPDDAAAIMASFEGAENMVIDKRIRDVAKGVFLTQDIIELNQSELEALLQTEANKVLEPLGIHLNFITLTFELDEQTRMAIDVSTAMKIYESRGLSEIGKQIMIQRAGAARIVIEKEAQAVAPVKED